MPQAFDFVKWICPQTFQLKQGIVMGWRPALQGGRYKVRSAEGDCGYEYVLPRSIIH